MFSFFHYDSPFMTWCYRVMNIVYVSILWTVFCIPIFTAGASTAAMYYTIQKCIKNNRSTVWRCFWQGFRSNFKKGSVCTLILLVFGLFFFADSHIVAGMAEYNVLPGWLPAVFKILIFAVCVYGFWIFAYMARFDGPIKMYFGNSVVFAILHLPVTIVIAVLGFGAVALIITLKPLIFVVPGVVVWLLSILTERVFRKYMTEADKETEDEWNMDYRDDYAGKFAEMKKRQRDLERQKKESKASI